MIHDSARCAGCCSPTRNCSRIQGGGCLAHQRGRVACRAGECRPIERHTAPDAVRPARPCAEAGCNLGGCRRRCAGKLTHRLLRHGHRHVAPFRRSLGHSGNVPLRIVKGAEQTIQEEPHPRARACGGRMPLAKLQRKNAVRLGVNRPLASSPGKTKWWRSKCR